MPNLIILAGVPGVGKSTWARTFFDLKYAIVSSDAIRIELAGTLREAHETAVKPWDVFYQSIATHLRQDVDVIADATFLTPHHRQRAAGVGATHHADVHLVLFKNWLEASVRNNARDPDQRVPLEAINDMMKLYWTSLAEIPQEHYATVTRIEAFS